ncbi:MAG: hypothetical protein WCN92_00765 [Eubacteriales bacterium]
MKKKIFKLISLVLALTLIFSLAACSGASTDTTTATTEPPVISKTPQPNTSAAAISYFNTVMDAVKSGKPAVSPKISKNINDIVCENASLKAAIPTLKNYMLNTKADSAKYGADLTNIFPVKGQTWGSKLTANDVKYASCLEALKTYEITIRFKDATEPAPLTSSLGKAFDLSTKASILKEFEKAATYITVDKLDLIYTGCYILCSVDRATDQVLSVTYITNVNAVSTVTGVGTLKDMGAVPISLRYDSNATYTLDWTNPA